MNLFPKTSNKRISRWGIVLTRPARDARERPIRVMPPPASVAVALRQHIGVAGTPIVAPGDRVLKGQPLTAGDSGLHVPVHAPVSGRVTAIEDRMVCLDGQGIAPCALIESDDHDEPWPGFAPGRSATQLSPVELRAGIAQAGIVGMGGGAFPTAIKLNPLTGIRTLILNGAECEPYMSCDDALLRERASEVVRGAVIMLQAIEADECIVAVKADMPEALTAATEAVHEHGDSRFRLAVVSARYPAGGERQLIQELTGIEVPARGLPWDAGFVCHNVATAAAIERFFYDGEPLISRIVTVAGKAVTEPCNVEARIGISIAELIAWTGGYREDARRLLIGGPMMGIALPHDDVPVTKGTNCVLALTSDEIGTPGTEMPCIRCGECSRVCPAYLMPQDLLALSRQEDTAAAEGIGLSACIECGCCDFVCPSHIPLTQRFIETKERLWDQRRRHQTAERARQRFEAHEARLKTRDADRRRELAEQQPQTVSQDDLDRLLGRVDNADPESGQRGGGR